MRLCDAYPDGRSFNICEGALRLRFRKGLEREEWLTEEPAEVEIRLWPTSMVFPRGHRLRVHLASSSSPGLEPNLQNGQPPRTGAARKANIEILFDEERPHLALPVMWP